MDNIDKISKEKQQDECEHDFQFSHTSEDWYDGDEDDNYICKKCNKWKVVYIGR